MGKLIGIDKALEGPRTCSFHERLVSERGRCRPIGDVGEMADESARYIGSCGLGDGCEAQAAVLDLYDRLRVRKGDGSGRDLYIRRLQKGRRVAARASAETSWTTRPPLPAAKETGYNVIVSWRGRRRDAR